MKRAFPVLLLALGGAGCATNLGPSEESFGESVARGVVEGLFDAVFRDGGTNRPPQRQTAWLASPPPAQGATPKKHWLAERAAQTSVSSPR